MRALFFMLLTITLVAGCSNLPTRQATSSAVPEVELSVPYDAFTLSNGLRVVVHEDRKAPIVAVSVWYHVGSKDEPVGKTGFAHLFEHLMFNGSENHDGEYFDPLEAVGVTDVNGTTWFDRTNYFQTVPTPALDLALFLESDRMGHLLGAVTQEKLDNQRSVVQNEKRQGDSQPFGTVEYRMLAGLFPEGHPYRWSTIGSMDDLNAASLDDVHNWFKDHYGPNNAVIVLAGDIDAATARPLMEKYFGDIPPGPAVARLKQMVPEKSAPTYDTMQDQVANTRIYRVWAVPGRTQQARYQLEVVAHLLGGGKTSRLYQKLVYQDQLASSVSVSVEPHELASQFQIQIDLKPGVQAAEVEPVLDALITQFLDEGPTAAEVAQARTEINASLVRGLEKVGGFGGKATLLAESTLYGGSPDFWQQGMRWMKAAERADLQQVAQRWLGPGFYQLVVDPYGQPKAEGQGIDRSALPQITQTPDISFPAVERATLSNGLEVVFARRATVPVVQLALQFDAGYAADFGAKPGLAKLAMSMLDEGTRDYSATELATALAGLGAELSAGSDLDRSTVSMSTLTATLTPSLKLLEQVVKHPTFAADELARQKQLLQAQLQKEWNSPVGIALHLLPPLLYGPDHAYGNPLTGSGNAASIDSITRDDLLTFQQQWLRPDNATLFVVGDTELETLVPQLEQTLGTWQPPAGAKGSKTIAAVGAPDKTRVVIVDRPGSPQSLILAGQLTPPPGKDELAIETMNNIIGGQFSARINMNLREDKGWAYGAYTFFNEAEGQQPLLVYAPVQSDKTGASIAELLRELRGFTHDEPATQQELEKVANYRARRLPGAYETAGAVLGALMDNQRYHRPDDYVATLAAQYRTLTLAEVRAAADLLAPDTLVWVIVGDYKSVAPQLEAIGLTDIQVMTPQP